MKIFLLFVVFLLTLAGWSKSSEQAAGCLDSLEIMSVFSPNSDDVNDVFSIYFPCVPEEFKISIFNRWGEEVFTSKSYTFAWDGKNTKGNDLNEGVYFYVLQFTFQSVEKSINGNITLIR